MKKTRLSAWAVTLLMLVGSSHGEDAQVPSQPVRDPFVDGPVLAPPRAGGAAADNRGYLGLVADDGAPGEGVRVNSVARGGPAEQAGLATGDIITAVDGQRIHTMDDLAAALAKRSAGARIKVAVERGAQEVPITVVLGKKPTAGQAQPLATPAKPTVLPVPPPKAVAPRAVPQLRLGQSQTPPADPRPAAPLGVRVVAVSAAVQEAQKLPMPRGAQVVRVTPGSAAEKAGIKVDNVLVAIDGFDIADPDDAARMLSHARPGQTMKFSLYEGGVLVEREVTPLPAAGLPGQPLARSPPTPARPGESVAPPRSAGKLPTPGPAAPAQSEQTPEEFLEDSVKRVQELEGRVKTLEQRLAQLEHALRVFTNEQPADPGSTEKAPAENDEPEKATP